MLRRRTWLAAPVFIRLIDTMRMDDPVAQPGVLFPVRVELGDGVNRMLTGDLQNIVDGMMAESGKYATVKTGGVYDRFGRQVREVFAGSKYIVSGNLRGGYVKNDMRFGLRLTGYNGASQRPGLRWNGDDL
jgi:hypothetical protein